MEEERRLAFVAMTRAEDRLYLTEAAGRNFDGSPRYPSRFILDVKPRDLEYETEPAAELIEETRAYIKLVNNSFLKENKEELLPVNTRVKHMIFNEGIILGYDMEMQAYVIQFDSQPTERFISFKVRLERLPS